MDVDKASEEWNKGQQTQIQRIQNPNTTPFKYPYNSVGPQGRIQQISSNSATVASWRYIQAEENVFYLQVGQSEVPFQKVNDQILSAAPDLSATGTGVNIELPIADKVAGKEGTGIADTLAR